MAENQTQTNQGKYQYPTQKCVFRYILEENLAGNGTSFLGRTPECLPCYECDGSAAHSEKLKCEKHVLLS